MNLSQIQIELTCATSGPWETNGQGMIINSITQKIIGYCSSDFDARLIVAMRNEIAEMITTLEDSYTEEQYTETCEEYDNEIESLKDHIDDLEVRHEQEISELYERIGELEDQNESK